MQRLTALASSLGLLLSGVALPAFAAPFAYIANWNGANVTVVDTATNKSVAAIPAQGNPNGVSIKPDGSRVYVANYASASVTVIDTLSNSVVKNITVGTGPEQTAIKPDGTRLYVPTWASGNVAVIDTASNTAATTVPIGGNLVGVAVNPGGSRAYIGRYDSNQIYALDTATNTLAGGPISLASPFGNGLGPIFLEVSPDGTRLYVVNQSSNNVSVINTATNAVVAVVPVGSFPYDLAIKPDGSRVYVANRNDNNVSVIDTASNTVVGTLPAGGGSPAGVDINPAGSRLYVTNAGSNTLSVFNLANNTLITNVPVGAGPYSEGHFIGPAPAPASTTRLSKSSSGSQGKDDSTQAAVSADGRYLAFVSEASNLVAGDTNGVADVFVRDRITKQTRRVSVSSGGIQANGPSYDPVISADGRFVAFSSDADNLVGADSNLATDVFVRDLAAGATTRVSVNSATPAVQGDGASYEPTLNADGSKVAFTSEATNLVTGDSNSSADIFIRDRASNTTSRVSIGTGAAGAQGNDASGQPYLSGSGQFVAFISRASNLVGSDTNNSFDVFVRDRTSNTTSRVSIASGAGGAQANSDAWQPALSSDGRYVVFAADASNLVAGDSNGLSDVFLRDRTSNITSRLSLDASGGQSDGPSYHPVISNDGRYVAFDSLATLDAVDYNLAWDVYLRDRTANATSRLSVSTATVEGNNDSQKPVMSADGRYVLFESFANNLDTGDTNNAWDIFVRDRGVGATPSYPLLVKPLQTPTGN